MNIQVNDEKYQKFYTDCVDDNDRIIHHRLLAYLIKTNNFLNSGGSLYHYNSQYGYWENVTNNVPNVAIRSYIPAAYQTLLDASRIKKTVADLIDSADITGTFISHPNLINVRNGVIDLKTMQLINHNRDIGFNYVNHFNYLQDAKITNAKSFCQYIVTSLGCENIESAAVHQVLEVLGYIVSEMRSAEKAIFLLGESNTGKSVLLNLIERIFQADEISSVGLHELDSVFRFSALAYSRINLLHEIKPVRIKCVDEFKRVVSCEDIIAEDKGKKPKRVRPRSIFVAATNSMPDFVGVELNDSIVNRLLIIRFLGGVGSDKINRNLNKELGKEIDTIFSAAVNTLPELLRKNLRFTIPDSTRLFLKSYAQSLNSVALFISDCCQTGGEHKVFSKTLYDAYVEFVKKNSLYKHSAHIFGMQIRSLKGVENKKIRIGSECLQGYIGIGLV